MAGLATVETNRSVSAYIENIDNASKQADSRTLVSLIEDVTGYNAKVWGNEKVPDFIIGFGNYKYKRKSGNEEFEWFNVGFAPRKTKLTVYLTFDIAKEEALLKKLGKCKWGKGCLYINKLADVDLTYLKQLIKKSKDAKWH